MELENRIRKILELEKFSNLSTKDKEQVFNSILANCLILSHENRDRYLNTIETRLTEIQNLKDTYYHKDGICYGGIVESAVSGPALDKEQTLFPFKYKLKYRENNTPLGQMTKSILHEFGHLVIKKDHFKLADDTNLIDMGGLVISKLLKNDYGHMFTEIINEFTNFLSYRAFLSYHTPNKDAENKMKEFAQKMGLNVEENSEYLNILPDDLFTSYTEEALAENQLEDGTERMFNPLYVKYTPLVRLMMFTFQNPLFSYSDLKREFESGKGLSAKINDIPINDLLYSYYESSFHIQDIFDSILEEQGSWEKYCLEFDSKMMDTKLDEMFIDSSIDLFKTFYQRRLSNMINEGIISEENANMKMNEYYLVSNNCKSYYDSIMGKTFK